jgi:manganese/zinc/iron transport system permease protein
MGSAMEIALVASVTAMACALPGTLLVLRRMALMSDAISHSILPGIVIGVLLGGSVKSPYALLGAVLAGLVLVGLVEVLLRSRRVHADAAIGLVFPVLFSIGVLLVARFAGRIHLDTDAVLLGELAFAPLDRLSLHGTDLGPRSLWTATGALALNLSFVMLCYKELKLGSFDPDLARAQGLRPGLLQQILLALTSITCVAAFDAVGSVLVVAVMIAPPAAAWLLTRRLGLLLALACLLAVTSSLLGYGLARSMDLSLAGSMAVCCTLVFLLAFLLAPGRGVLALRLVARRQRERFAVDLLLVHLLHHEGDAAGDQEDRVEHLSGHFGWSGRLAERTVQLGGQAGLLVRNGAHLGLTEAGREQARTAMIR